MLIILKILYTAFNGKLNSSKILLDKIKTSNKLYLTNSFSTSVNQLKKELKNNSYDLIISFGQAPLDNDNIRIETIGQKEEIYITKYDYISLQNKLIFNNYKATISNDAGNYLCNNIYYHGLKYIEDNNINTKMIFIHIPEINQISDIDNLAKLF